MVPMMTSDVSSDEDKSAMDLNKLTAASKPEPIAICGFACKLPGNSRTPEEFWKFISEGRSAQREAPNSRFNVDAFYHPDGINRPGSIGARGGYFLNEDIREFENSFFGINNLEATYMDPEQRKLLEVVFQCFESAGVPLEKASGSNTGCYVAKFTNDFVTMQGRDADYCTRYGATGTGSTILANRISHVFNLHGPSLALDTACSSSLYCLHVARVALQNFECDSAIVAGANLIQSVEQHLSTMKAGVLSPTSTCHTFDASADGYGRADGVNALYLKRLSDAIRDGDCIRSVIRSSAINANGKTAGISLPSADGQEKVIRKAYNAVGLDPSETTYVECHGTGTKVGDAIEIEALSRVFHRTAQAPLLVGSVKANLGHSEAASGISSIIKSSLILETGFIPPVHGLRTVNPKLKVEERGISIPKELMAWPDYSSSSIHRLGINSFGYGGANSHVILEAACDHVPQMTSAETAMRETLGNQSLMCLPISASSVASLDARTVDLAQHNFKDTELKDLAFTLCARRSELSSRGFILASANKTLAENFATQPFVTISSTPSHLKSPFAFVFTGQGAQWAGMCRELFVQSEFRDAIREMESVLSVIPHSPGWSLTEAIMNLDDTDLIQKPDRSQSCCTAIQVALVRMLASWGISPAAVIGHSSGEIAAAFAAGQITAAEAIVISYYRGYSVSHNKHAGAMLALGLPHRDASEKINKLHLADKIQIACINSPENVTLSGDIEAIDMLFNEVQQGGMFARKLKTGGQAYHSHHMHTIGEEYQEMLEKVMPSIGPSFSMPQTAVFISSVTLKEKTSEFDNSYWRSNLQSSVLFGPALEKLLLSGDYSYVELGPHSALELPLKQTLAVAGVPRADIKYSSVIRRGSDSLETALDFIGRLWLSGSRVNWLKVNALSSFTKSQRSPLRVIPDLPSYKFNYDAVLWHEPRASSEYRHRKYPRHELLGSLVPGGSGQELMFRNILRPNDVGWLKDHKLEEAIVFPGAGYLAIAMEAVMQGSNVSISDCPSFEMNNVNILNALILSDEATTQVELFTTLRKSQLSHVSVSENWWDFSISTHQDGAAVMHALGSIATPKIPPTLQSKYKAPDDSLESNAPRVWYQRLARQGLKFGPAFQSISDFFVSCMKDLPYCATNTTCLQYSGDKLSIYPIHPITLDSILQTGIVATAHGNPKDLRAKVPTRFGTVQITTPPSPFNPSCSINSSARITGFGVAEVGAELILDGNVVAQFDQIRTSPYEVVDHLDNGDKRHPMLRVLWKPDPYGVSLMTASAALSYIQEFTEGSQVPKADAATSAMLAMIDLLAHKNSRMAIREAGNADHDVTMSILDVLASRSEFKRFFTYHCADINGDSTLYSESVDLESGQRTVTQECNGQSFELLIVPSFDPRIQVRYDEIQEGLSEQGLILALCRDNATANFLKNKEYLTLRIPISEQISIVLAQKARISHLDERLQKFGLLIVERDIQGSALGDALADYFRKFANLTLKRAALDDISTGDIIPGITVISLVEFPSPLLINSTEAQMHQVKLLTQNAARVVWVTNGNIIEGIQPDFAAASGISRTLMLEQPSTLFYNLDIDKSDADPAQISQNVLSILNQSVSSPDFEFAQKDGQIYISRFVPDSKLNDSFRVRQGHESRQLTLGEVGQVRLNIKQPGNFSTLIFQQLDLTDSELKSCHIRIRVAAVGLNAKDYYVLAGKTDTKDSTCSLECCGTVEAIGKDVESFQIGDRVVAVAPTHFQTYQDAPYWACHLIGDDQDFNTVCTLPVAFSTAIYALHDRAMIQQGESVLIHCGAGGVGIAAIQIAQAAGAEIFTTVSNDMKKQYLVDNFGLRPEHIFNSRDTSFKDGILQATNNKGVDVIINSLTGDQLHATWKCCAPFGRFVEIGKFDISTAGRLDMNQFLKNVSFTAFDLSDLYHPENKVQNLLLKRLLGQVMKLFSSGKIQAIRPLEIFDISKLSDAFRYFSSRNRMGKIAINLQNTNSRIPVQSSKYTTRLSPDKFYIMVGCLGGLGCSLSRWMLQRGAKKFVFLGRTGLQRPVAQRLVKGLEALGATCIVVKGDVCNRTDVDRAVASASGEIGGIVQAAMGLNEAIFATMSNESWHTGIDPKIKGTWNLHNSTRASGRDQNLDFFLMTSSVSGTVGHATEANYCAGNYFLDLFARFRRSLQLPAISVGLGMISEVGYLHENPDIEALLLRKGIQALDEDDMLQIIDIALSQDKMGIAQSLDSNAISHILTGLEPHGLKEIRKLGFEVTNPALSDPRAQLLAGALDEPSDATPLSQYGNLPKEVATAMDAGKTLDEAIRDHICWRFGHMVLMKTDAVDLKRALAEYGMDSMIAAELRTWFHQTFKVDIPFLSLLSKTTNLEGLATTVVKELNSRT